MQGQHDTGHVTGVGQAQLPRDHRPSPTQRRKKKKKKMVLELHVWGPAFSLPSIDAQCLATIAYLSQTVPKEAWVLVASSDPTVSPTCMF